MDAKGQEREADLSLPCNAEVKEGGATPPLYYTYSWQMLNSAHGKNLPFFYLLTFKRN
jgi:hypothetical protein